MVGATIQFAHKTFKDDT